MIHLEKYFHINAFVLADEVHSLMLLDGEKYPDINGIYSFIEDFFDNGNDMGYNQIAYASCNYILKRSNETNFPPYKWLGQYMVKAIMENNTDVLDMDDVFCIVF